MSDSSTLSVVNINVSIQSQANLTPTILLTLFDITRFHSPIFDGESDAMIDRHSELLL